MRRLHLLLSIAAVCSVCAACERRTLSHAPAAASTTASAGAWAPAPSSDAGTRLPEDPAAGARSVAQWSEHLAEEERARKASYDRRRLKQHHQVLALLRAVRRKYDRATTPAALEKVQGDSASIARIRQKVDELDPWANSSNAREDYVALLELLSATYPAARRRALDGEAGELSEAQRAFDARMDKVSKWLAYAAEAEERD